MLKEAAGTVSQHVHFFRLRPRLHELRSSSAYTNFSHVRNLLNLIFSILSFPTKDVWPFERTNSRSLVASFERAVVRDTHVSVCCMQPRTGVQLSYSSMRLFGVDFRDVHQTESLLPESSAANTEGIFEMNLHYFSTSKKKGFVALLVHPKARLVP